MAERSSVVDLEPAARHRAVAAHFTSVARQVTDWGAPTPVAEWRAVDVVGHLVEWFPGFLAAGGIELAPGPPIDDDPVAAWEAHTAAIQSLVDDEAAAASEFSHPLAGSHQLDQAVDRFYTADVFMHTWDLARSAGLEPNLDPAWCDQMVAGMAEIDEMLRSSGQYGPPVSVPTDADAETRLVGFIGRDPHWMPPHR